MRQWLSLVLWLGLGACVVQAQRVGLVLSGGGSRGLAHIGVLKALEEHHLPVDYITGTSMGAMIGAFYAAGYSPTEIEQIARREAPNWLAPGLVFTEGFYLNRDRTDMTFLQVPLLLRDADRLLPEYLFSDYGINSGLNHYLGVPSMNAGNNFDSLLVPYRALASDLYDQKSVVLKDGSLTFAVRASIAVPLLLLPASNPWKGSLFDGGLYNNFPADVMQAQFAPDFTLGIHVGDPPLKRNEYEAQRAYLNRLLTQTMDMRSYDKLPPNAYFLQPALGNLEGTDFSATAIDSAISAGYHTTLRCIEDLKRSIARRTDPDSLAAARARLRHRPEVLPISSLTASGARIGPNEQDFIRKLVRLKTPGVTQRELDRALNRLRIDGGYLSTLPELLPDSTHPDHWRLHLNLKPAARFQVRAGGAFFTPTDHQLQLGADYSGTGRARFGASVDLLRGSFQNAISAGTRLDFIGSAPITLEAQGLITAWEYQQSRGFFPNQRSTNITQYHQQFQLAAGARVYGVGRLWGGYAVSEQQNRYGAVDILADDPQDLTRYTGGMLFARFERSTLNRKQYADHGRYTYASFGYHHGLETRVPAAGEAFSETFTRDWLQIRIKIQQYAIVLRRLRMGFSLDAAHSNLQTFATPNATKLVLPRFLPLQDSPLLYQERLIAPTFIAPGTQLSFRLRESTFLRVETYWMQRLQRQRSGGQSRFILDWDDKTVVGSAGLVYHTLVGPIAIFANYYEGPRNPVRLFAELGFLIFQRHPWD